jgi:hypothetical protein
MATKLVDIRRICMSLRDTYEQFSNGHPTFFITEGPYLVFVSNHRGDDHPAIWVAQPPGGQAELLKVNPAFFFRPPAADKSDWIGIDLRSGVPPVGVQAIIVEGHDSVYWKRKQDAGPA